MDQNGLKTESSHPSPSSTMDVLSPKYLPGMTHPSPQSPQSLRCPASHLHRQGQRTAPHHLVGPCPPNKQRQHGTLTDLQVHILGLHTSLASVRKDFFPGCGVFVEISRYQKETMDVWEWTKMYLTDFQPCHTPSSWMLLVSSPRKLKVILQDSISKSPEKGWGQDGKIVTVYWDVATKSTQTYEIHRYTYILLPTCNNTKAPPQPIRPFVSLGYQCLASPLLPFQSPASSIEIQHCHGRWIRKKIATSQCFIPPNISKCFIALYIFFLTQKNTICKRRLCNCQSGDPLIQ